MRSEESSSFNMGSSHQDRLEEIFLEFLEDRTYIFTNRQAEAILTRPELMRKIVDKIFAAFFDVDPEEEPIEDINLEEEPYLFEPLVGLASPDVKRELGGMLARGIAQRVTYLEQIVFLYAPENRNILSYACRQALQPFVDRSYAEFWLTYWREAYHWLSPDNLNVSEMEHIMYRPGYGLPIVVKPGVGLSAIIEVLRSVGYTFDISFSDSGWRISDTRTTDAKGYKDGYIAFAFCFNYFEKLSYLDLTMEQRDIARTRGTTLKETLLLLFVNHLLWGPVVSAENSFIVCPGSSLGYPECEDEIPIIHSSPGQHISIASMPWHRCIELQEELLFISLA